MLEELLKDLGTRIGTGPLEMDANGVCRIGFGDGAQILIGSDESDPNQCIVIGNCGGVPASGRIAFMRRLLEANFFHRDTGDTVIALEPDLDEALMIQRVRLDTIDGQGLVDAVTSFLAYQQRWTERATEAARVTG